MVSLALEPVFARLVSNNQSSAYRKIIYEVKLMNKAYIGIDIAKHKFDVALLLEGNNHKLQTFANNLEGFEKLLHWLNEIKDCKFYVCLESTGVYGQKLACYLSEKNIYVSFVKPLSQQNGSPIQKLLLN